MPESYPVIVLALDAAAASRVLSDNRTFTVDNYASKMGEVIGPFFLGLDYEDPRYLRQVGMLHDIVRPDDPDRLFRCARDAARAQMIPSSAGGEVDVVDWTARTLDRFVESYFGVPAIPAQGGDGSSGMLNLNQHTASYIFGLDFLVTHLRQRANEAGQRIDQHLAALIERKLASRDHAGETIVDRLILGVTSSEDAEAARIVLAGTLSGLYVPTSNQFVRVVDYLIDLSPRDRDGFGAAVRDRANLPEALPAEDNDLVARHVHEAARFGPFPFGLIRHCPGGARLESGSGRTKAIPPGATVVALTAAAVLDPRLAPNPGGFLIGRPAEHYMLFGSGHHRCIGATPDWPVANALMTEMVTELFRLPGLRRAPGRRGSIRKKDSWPHSFVLEHAGELSGGLSR
jgi:cytochrome P450